MEASRLNKLLILYLLEHAKDSLSNSQITEFMLSKDYTTYFSLQTSLSDLVDDNLVTIKTIGNTSYYKPTVEGSKTLSLLESDISKDMIIDLKSYLKNINNELENRILSPASYFINSHGEYTVQCQVIERNNSVIDITFIVPTLDAAKAICKSWPTKYNKIYSKILDELM